MRTDAPPSAAERYCAWFGAARDGILYFGESAFWSAKRRHGGDPAADLLHPGPRRIGRFDLASETLLPALVLAEAGARSGVWDVHAADDGWLYFTDFFEAAGRLHPGHGRVDLFPGLGTGLNELAPGPDGGLLASRYGPGAAGTGSVLHFDASGRALAEWPLSGPPGYTAAPKTVAWDPARSELWATADLLPLVPGAPIGHEAFVLDGHGRLRRTIAAPEIHFVTLHPDGSLLRAEIGGGALHLRLLPPTGAARPARRLLLDARFPAALDFVQDIQVAPDGRIAVTRWSGRVHVIDAAGRVAGVSLPRLDPDGLYYTGVLRGERVCATYCADVSVVCADAPR